MSDASNFPKRGVTSPAATSRIADATAVQSIRRACQAGDGPLVGQYRWVAGTVWLDFDGTLAYRPSMWAEACIGVLDELVTGHGLAHVDVDAALGTGMPWHRPELCHEDLNDPELWWEAVAARTGEALSALGVSVSAQEIKDPLRRSIVDAESYRLFDDTLEALELVAASGWRAGVVSNHIPELEHYVRSWVSAATSTGCSRQGQSASRSRTLRCLRWRWPEPRPIQCGCSATTSKPTAWPLSGTGSERCWSAATTPTTSRGPSRCWLP